MRRVGALIFGPALGFCFALLLDCGLGHAQSAAAIQQYVAKRNPGCDIFGFAENYRGPLAGSPRPVVIAAYTVEGCGRGNYYERFFGVFYDENGTVQQYKKPPGTLNGVERVTVAGGRITVHMKQLGPNDPRCCPTVSRQAVFELRDGAIVPVK